MKTKIAFSIQNELLKQTLLDANQLLDDVEFVASDQAIIVEQDSKLKIGSDIFHECIYIPELIESAKRSVKAGGLALHELELIGQTLHYRKEELALSGVQAKIMQTLMLASPNAVSKDVLRNDILKYSKDSNTNTLENHISRLRSKIKDTNFEIVSVDGYALKKST